MVYPSACSSPITASQLEPSAHGPCWSTVAGLGPAALAAWAVAARAGAIRLAGTSSPAAARATAIAATRILDRWMPGMMFMRSSFLAAFSLLRAASAQDERGRVREIPSRTPVPGCDRFSRPRSRPGPARGAGGGDRPGALQGRGGARPAYAGPAGSRRRQGARPRPEPAAGQGRMPPRLAAGKNPNRKRMAPLAWVSDAEPAPRRPHDVIAPPGGRHGCRKPRPGPKARARWLAGSVEHAPAEVIAAAFDQAEARDPAHRRRRVVLVDGAEHQLDLIRADAARRGVTISILIDLIHVLELSPVSVHDNRGSQVISLLRLMCRYFVVAGCGFQPRRSRLWPVSMV